MQTSTETTEQRLGKKVSDWVHGIAPWSIFFTGTFEGEFTEGSARRAFERFMKKHCSSVSYFYVIERNPSRAGHHVHALFADCEALQRSHVWNLWKKCYGRNRVEPVFSQEDVTSYCSKHVCDYLTKGVGWYNVKLVSPDLWHANKAKA